VKGNFTMDSEDDNDDIDNNRITLKNDNKENFIKQMKNSITKKIAKLKQKKTETIFKLKVQQLQMEYILQLINIKQKHKYSNAEKNKTHETNPSLLLQQTSPPLLPQYTKSVSVIHRQEELEFPFQQSNDPNANNNNISQFQLSNDPNTNNNNISQNNKNMKNTTNYFKL